MVKNKPAVKNKGNSEKVMKVIMDKLSTINQQSDKNGTIILPRIGLEDLAHNLYFIRNNNTKDFLMKKISESLAYCELERISIVDKAYGIVDAHLKNLATVGIDFYNLELTFNLNITKDVFLSVLEKFKMMLEDLGMVVFATLNIRNITNNESLDWIENRITRVEIMLGIINLSAVDLSGGIKKFILAGEEYAVNECSIIRRKNTKIYSDFILSEAMFFVSEFYHTIPGYKMRNLITSIIPDEYYSITYSKPELIVCPKSEFEKVINLLILYMKENGLFLRRDNVYKFNEMKLKYFCSYESFIEKKTVEIIKFAREKFFYQFEGINLDYMIFSNFNVLKLLGKNAGFLISRNCNFLQQNYVKLLDGTYDLEEKKFKQYYKFYWIL